MSDRRPSLKDVAREAGVSYQTVSRVINDGPRVSATTRQRVQAVIAQLGYHRNQTARSLVTSRSQSIGVVADGSPKFGPVSTLAAVEQAARNAGFTALVSTVSYPDPASVAATFAEFVQRGVEGIVVIAPRVSLADVTNEIRASLPIVMLAPGETSHPGITVFYEDQFEGARLATRHLIDLGHREVAHLAGSQDWLDGQVRLRGWQAELRSHSLPAPAVRYSDWSGDSAYAIGYDMIRRGLPSAIFVASDLMALGFMRALSEHGLRVPEAIS
ncbi:MAG: LacI family DNA-binding transcriptional regulator, partial [Arachnia sp.]